MPVWWYWVAGAGSLVLGIIACEVYPVQLHWYGVLLAFAVSALFFVPVSLTLPKHAWLLETDTCGTIARLGLRHNQRKDSD